MKKTDQERDSSVTRNTWGAENEAGSPCRRRVGAHSAARGSGPPPGLQTRWRDRPGRGYQQEGQGCQPQVRITRTGSLDAREETGKPRDRHPPGWHTWQGPQSSPASLESMQVTGAVPVQSHRETEKKQEANPRWKSQPRELDGS